MAEATPTQKGKAWWALVAVIVVGILIGVGATAVNGMLRGLVERSERSQLLLERLEGQANRLSALEWEVIAEEGMTSETFEGVRVTRIDMALTLRDLELQHSDLQMLGPVRRTYEEYLAAVDDEFALVRDGRLQDARLLDQEKVDPAFDALRDTIVPAREAFGSRAEWLEQISIVGFAVILFVANAATVLLFWGFQRAQQATGLAIAEQKSLAHHEECARLLGEMGERLRASTALPEAYDVVAHYSRRLFPNDSGALYVFDASRDAFEAVQVWGGDLGHDLEAEFGRDECQASLTGHPFWTTDSSIGSACAHVGRSGRDGSLCVPMMSRGDTLGVLHLRYSGPLQGGLPVDSAVTTRRELAISVAESAALELTNLRLRDALQDQATHDPLSGLCNRRFMEATFDHELARAARHHTPVSVVMVDVDRFKVINDTLGHAAGDSAIVELSALLRESFREEDIICRYGGDEFVVVLPGSTLGDAHRRAERLQSEVRRRVAEKAGHELPALTVSLGISAFPRHGTTTDSLIDAADSAMYQAKAQGRDRLVVAPDKGESASSSTARDS